MPDCRAESLFAAHPSRAQCHRTQHRRDLCLSAPDLNVYLSRVVSLVTTVRHQFGRTCGKGQSRVSFGQHVPLAGPPISTSRLWSPFLHTPLTLVGAPLFAIGILRRCWIHWSRESVLWFFQSAFFLPSYRNFWTWLLKFLARRTCWGLSTLNYLRCLVWIALSISCSSIESLFLASRSDDSLFSKSSRYCLSFLLWPRTSWRIDRNHPLLIRRSAFALVPCVEWWD